MKLNKSDLKKNVAMNAIWAVTTSVGTFLMAVGFSVFLVPKNIVAGGFSGIALMISYIIELVAKVQIPKGWIYIILNIPLFIISWKSMGKSFLFLSFIGTITYSVFIDVVKLDFLVDDALLCALYGGIFTGIGLGLVVRSNGSTGGTDMLGNILHRVNPKITVGTCVISIDVVVIAMNVYFNAILVALYAIVAIFIQGLICDFISEGPRSVKAYYVISEKYEEISRKILVELHRGVTAIDAKGMFSQNERKMLLCLISRRQVQNLNSIVFSVDPNAFVFSTNCKDAIGNGFNKPDKPKKSSDFSRILSGEKIEKVETIKKVLPTTNVTVTTGSKPMEQKLDIPKTDEETK